MEPFKTRDLMRASILYYHFRYAMQLEEKQYMLPIEQNPHGYAEFVFKDRYKCQEVIEEFMENRIIGELYCFAECYLYLRRRLNDFLRPMPRKEFR